MLDPDRLKNLLSRIPPDPGVYLMKDGQESVIYIGKASSLKKRVSSYFQKTDQDPKTRILVRAIADIEYIVTDSEIEALLLESTLIKKHRPKYNIRLKDDKRYPYISVTLAEPYPRVIFTRAVSRKENRYFGPYTDARAARNTVVMINNIFRLKRCTRELPLKTGERPCLNYQMGKCAGACTGEITAVEYRELVDNAIIFLEGRVDPVIENLQALMKRHAAALRYEKAREVRDMIFDIQTIAESQKVSAPIGRDEDFIGAGIFGHEALIILFEFRKGVLLGRKISVYDNADYAGPDDVIREFILSYYARADIPQRIVTQHTVAEREVMAAYFTERSGRNVTISAPRGPDERGVMSLLAKNIDIIAADRKAGAAFENREAGLLEIAGLLGLASPPAVMECVDISHIQGTDAVASLVCFRDGRPDKSSYRRYRIRGYEGINDPGMIHEVVSRRLQYLVNEGQELPGLLIVDGGIPQLTRAREAARNFAPALPIVALAKRLEELFYDPAVPPLHLPARSPALHLFQQIRDEAHRFAVTYHRKLRSKRMTTSALDGIPGGEAMAARLRDRFNSIEGIRAATIEEIGSVHGIGQKRAERIYRFLHDENGNDIV